MLVSVGVSRCRAGAPDPSLTANAGLAAITELCDRLGVVEELDAAVGPVKQRDRGLGAGELLTGIAAAQLAGEDFLTGLDRQRADAAGQRLTPVPGLASTTAAGLARRITPWAVAGGGVRPGGGHRPDAVLAAACRSGPRRSRTGRSPSTWTPPTWRSTAARSAAWPITIKASGPACRTSRRGRRPRRCWPLTWATAPMTRARPRRTCCAARWPPCRNGHGNRGGWRCAPTPGTSPGSWPAPRTRRTSASRSARQADRPAVAAAGRHRRGGLA